MSENQKTPMEQILQILNVKTEEEAVDAVMTVLRAYSELDAALATLTVIPVVMVNGKPVLVQMPSENQQHSLETLEIIRDGLIDSAALMRGPIMRSRAKKLEKAVSAKKSENADDVQARE
jgi:hypothetical protein